MLTYDQYLTPASLEEAVSAPGLKTGDVRVIAGATDILPWARQGRAGDVHYPTLMDVCRVPELSGIQLAAGRLTIGACTTIAQLVAEPLLLEYAPLLACSAVWFADTQIREQATVGGNLVNASPAGDTVPPLLALNASVTLYRRLGAQVAARRLPLSEFILGPGRNALALGELLGTIEFDALPQHGAAFEKVGHRRSLVISTVCVVAVARSDAQRRRIEDVRIALGGIGPVPERLVAGEALLNGAGISAACIREAAALAAERVASRTRREYRREVVANFVAQAVSRALERSGVAPELLEREEASYV